MIKRIMFVCHGNICRSPMAEFVMKKFASEAGLELEISSAAVSDEEIYGGVGNPVYPQAARVMRSHGLDPSGKRAVKLQKADLSKYDLFVCMDEENVRGVRSILGPAAESKTVKLLACAGEEGDVADPWYTGKFEYAYADIERGCRALLTAIKTEKIK